MRLIIYSCVFSNNNFAVQSTMLKKKVLHGEGGDYACSFQELTGSQLCMHIVHNAAVNKSRKLS